CRGLVETLARWAGVALGGRTAEQKLADQTAALECVVGASPHPVAIAEWVPGDGSNDDLEFTVANDPAVRMLGVGVGDRLSDALPPRTLLMWTTACRRALMDEGVQRFRTDLVSPGNTELSRYAVTLALVAPPEPGRPGRFSIQAEDTTGRRHIRDHLHERESQLRAVLERAPILLFEVDETGRFSLCEGRALALSGLTAEDLLGDSVFERYRGHPEATQAMGRVLAGESASWRLQLGGRTLDVWAEPSRARSGETVGARGVAVDITEMLEAQRLAEETLEETIADSRHSADLIALLSHGLRVPLATVLGFSDLLSEDGTDAPEAGAAISRAAGEILETLDGFVDLTRLSALRTGRPRPVSTPGLEGALATSVAEGAPAVEVAVTVRPIDAPILLDLSLLRAVVRRVASLATSGPLAVLADLQGELLCIRMSGGDLGSRLSTDSLDVAYVHHAVSALDAELVIGPDGSVGLGIPVRYAPVVILDDAASPRVEGDGTEGGPPTFARPA
ncbi:MAG: PAS domain S-box protein, partial [Bacteroidota bacterium]